LRLFFSFLFFSFLRVSFFVFCAAAIDLFAAQFGDSRPLMIEWYNEKHTMLVSHIVDVTKNTS
jgi:hypothetical protein